MSIRESIETALAKPLPEQKDDIGDTELFDPWEDVIQNIYGSYSSESDDLMLAALRAARDRTTFDLIAQRGFAAELVLYVLAGHGLLEYGTSPRGGWPDPEVKDLWQPLIDKWEAWAKASWGEDWQESE